MTYLSRTAFEQLSPAEQSRLLLTHIPLGRHPETREDWYLPNQDRFGGMYILGNTGSGKSGLLQNLIACDEMLGNAVVVIDPHGDLINDCIAQLPPHRLAHTYLLDMEDEAYPFGINLFAHGPLKTERDRSQLLNRILHVFEVLWPEVADQQYLTMYVQMAVQALLATPHTTLADLLPFLNPRDDTYRAHILSQPDVPERIRRWWQDEYEALKPQARQQRIQALLNRLYKLFMGSELVHNIVGQRRTTISFRRAIENREIIFVRLPTKVLTHEAELIGMVIVAQIHAALFSFADLPAERRPGFSLYIDEFQHFVTKDIEEFITEGRKFGIRLTIAHQLRSQLDDELRSATAGTRTKICLRVNAPDATAMAPYYPLSGPGKLEEVEVYATAALLKNPGTDYHVRQFTDTYLRPLQPQRSAGKVRIRQTGLSMASVLWQGYDDTLKAAKKAEPVTEDDPTQYLDDLLRRVMEERNPNLRIPLKVVLGFSNCGRGFHKEAKKRGDGRELDGSFIFPPNLVYHGRWMKVPSNGQEQLLHFVWHLRQTMTYLAANPLGKRAAITSAVSGLPQAAQVLRCRESRTSCAVIPSYVSGMKRGLFVVSAIPPRPFCTGQYSIKQRASAPVAARGGERQQE